MSKESVKRVEEYIARRKKSRGIDIEHVHGFDVGPDCGVELLLSDIEAILSAAAPQVVADERKLPPPPEMASAADLAYVMQTPEDWDADYRSTWQKLQVEAHNKRQWRKYALELRAALLGKHQVVSDEADLECQVPPFGWRCTRGAGHPGPCAAVECPEDVAAVERGMDRLAAAPVQAQEPVAVVYPPDGTVSPFTVINLGHGLVKIGDSLHDGRLPALWFGKDGLGMGVSEEMNRAAKEGETLAVVTFSNVEGLDVLAEVVQRIRSVAFPTAPAAPGDAEDTTRLQWMIDNMAFMCQQGEGWSVQNAYGSDLGWSNDGAREAIDAAIAAKAAS